MSVDGASVWSPVIERGQGPLYLAITDRIAADIGMAGCGGREAAAATGAGQPAGHRFHHHQPRLCRGRTVRAGAQPGRLQAIADLLAQAPALSSMIV
jgi:hypothetical protein